MYNCIQNKSKVFLNALLTLLKYTLNLLLNLNYNFNTKTRSSACSPNKNITRLNYLNTYVQKRIPLAFSTQLKLSLKNI